MMMRKKYLFFDVDGTLVSKTSHTIPKSAVQAIKMTRNRGNECFAVTGKSYGRAQDIRYTGVNDMVICDGAGVVINDRLVDAHPIPHDTLISTLKLIETFGGHYQIMDWVNTYQDAYYRDLFLNRYLKHYPDAIPKEMMKRKWLFPLRDYGFDTDILKIDVTFDDQENLYSFRHVMDHRQLRYITVMLDSDDDFPRGGEIVMKGVSKGAGIAQMMTLIGGEMKDTIGFGDSPRDIGMLKACEVAVVLGEGSERLREVADYMTEDADEGGLAIAMAQLDLI